MRLLERRTMKITQNADSTPTDPPASRGEPAALNGERLERSHSTPPEPRPGPSSPSAGSNANEDKCSPRRRRSSLNTKLRRQLSAINSLEAIKLKMFIFGLALVATIMPHLSGASFFSFYFPNIFKPKGYNELGDMISLLDDHINSTADHFSDTQYFWGQVRRLDSIQITNNYPEISACAEILPVFRELAIEYVHIDYEFYLKPYSHYRQYLVDFQSEWYPKKHESKTALPRQWEQKLLQTELQLKIDYLEKLVNEREYRDKRQKMVDIWRNVRRSLDDSLQCIYLRYAYRQIAQDINQVALEANLEHMRKAMRVLVKAYERIAKFKNSDEKIIKEIEEELQENERFTIKE